MKKLYLLILLITYVFSSDISYLKNFENKSIYPLAFTFKEFDYNPVYPINISNYKKFDSFEIWLSSGRDDELSIVDKLICPHQNGILNTMKSILQIEDENSSIFKCKKFFKIFFKKRIKTIEVNGFTFFVYDSQSENDLRAIVFKNKKVLGAIYLSDAKKNSEIFYNILNSIEENKYNYNVENILELAQQAQTTLSYNTAMKLYLSAQMLAPNSSKVAKEFQKFIDMRYSVSKQSIELD